MHVGGGYFSPPSIGCTFAYRIDDGFVLRGRYVFAGEELLGMVFRPHFDYLVGMSVTAKEGRTEKPGQACRLIGRPKVSRPAQSDSVEGRDDGAQADGVAGGAMDCAQCAQISRRYRQ